MRRSRRPPDVGLYSDRSISAGEKRIAEAPQLCDTGIYEGLRSYSSQVGRQ
jgi:hypothetical protein